MASVLLKLERVLLSYYLLLCYTRFVLCEEIPVSVSGQPGTLNRIKKRQADDHIDRVLGLEPKFDGLYSNVSVVVGRTVVLPCSIEDLGKHKVAWVDPSAMILTYEDRRIVDDTRFTMVRPHVQDWHLQIRETRTEDTGRYNCTMNTYDVKAKTVDLFVRVPPRLLDSNKEETAREGSDMTLHCNFTGIPAPRITWHWRPLVKDFFLFRDRWRVSIGGQNQPCPVGVETGAVLAIKNLSRHCTGYFVCSADNQVEPSVEQRIPINVEFAPEVQVTNKKIGQYRGKDTILECQVFAHPLGITHWEKDGKRLMNSQKHTIDLSEHFAGSETMSRRYCRHITLSLKFVNITDDDYGAYKCIAKNSLGNNSDETILHEIKKVPEVSANTKTSHILNGNKIEFALEPKQAKQNGALPVYRSEAINFRLALSDELKSGRGTSIAFSVRIFLLDFFVCWITCYHV